MLRFLLLGLMVALPAWAECPEIQLRLLPSYQAVYDGGGNVVSRFLKYLVLRQEDDDGTFVYNVCLTYYPISTQVPGLTRPADPPCVQTTIGSVDGAVVQFDVLAGWTFDIQSSVTLLNGEEVFSDRSACAVVTGASDLTGDGRTGGPDFSLFVDEIGMEFSETDPEMDPNHNAP